MSTVAGPVFFSHAELNTKQENIYQGHFMNIKASLNNKLSIKCWLKTGVVWTVVSQGIVVVREESRLILLCLTLMLLVANFAFTKWHKKPEKWSKPWQMCTHLKILSKSFLMNTNIPRFRWFSQLFAFLCLWRKLREASTALVCLSVVKQTLLLEPPLL